MGGRSRPQKLSHGRWQQSGTSGRAKSSSVLNSVYRHRTPGTVPANATQGPVKMEVEHSSRRHCNSWFDSVSGPRPRRSSDQPGAS